MADPPFIIALVGRPNHGKTTLLEKLIPELKKRGCRVGTIKHHVHEFAMDIPGKDTWRHKRAGAEIVALSSPTGLGIIRDVDEDPEVRTLVARYFTEVDLVIAEGYKRTNLPKIEVYRRETGDSPLENRDSTWIAMVTDPTFSDDLPCFGSGNISALADFLLAQIGQTAQE